MICTYCKTAADIVGGRAKRAPCPDCGRLISLTLKTNVMVHHLYGPKTFAHCSGTGKPPHGHEMCKGGTHCDCQCKGKDGPLGPRY